MKFHLKQNLGFAIVDDIDMHFGKNKFSTTVRGPRREWLFQILLESFWFSTLANFDRKNGAQINKNRFKQPSHPKVH